MQETFELNLKTKLYFGKGKENEVGNILKEYHANKVLIVTGQGSVVKSGLLDKVIKALNASNIEFIQLSGVRPNPTIDLVRKGLEIVKKEGIDFLLAVGGGSVMDTTKLIATGFYYDGDPFDISRHLYIPKKAMPFGVINTISASGSEMSNSCVIQDDELGIKAGYGNDLNRPLFAICNPEYTFSVSPYQTSVGTVDIMMHTLERYFSNSSASYEPSDDFAIALLKNVKKAGLEALKNPCDYDARATLMLLSSVSHNGITSIGKKYSMPVHQIEHALSATYPSVAHGAGLAVLFPAWLKYYLPYETSKIARLGKEVFNTNYATDLENAKMCIVEIEKYFKALGMPLTFKDLGIKNPDIDLMAKRFSNNGTRLVDHKDKPLDQNVAVEIYKLAM